jgi:hypothetical protein
MIPLPQALESASQSDYRFWFIKPFTTVTTMEIDLNVIVETIDIVKDLEIDTQMTIAVTDAILVITSRRPRGVAKIPLAVARDVVDAWLDSLASVQEIMRDMSSR